MKGGGLNRLFPLNNSLLPFCPVALPLSESVQVQVGSGQWFRSRPRRRIALRPLLPPGSSTTTAPLVTWKPTSPLQLLPQARIRTNPTSPAPSLPPLRRHVPAQNLSKIRSFLAATTSCPSVGVPSRSSIFFLNGQTVLD